MQSSTPVQTAFDLAFDELNREFCRFVDMYNQLPIEKAKKEEAAKSAENKFALRVQELILESEGLKNPISRKLQPLICSILRDPILMPAWNASEDSNKALFSALVKSSIEFNQNKNIILTAASQDISEDHKYYLFMLYPKKEVDDLLNHPIPCDNNALHWTCVGDALNHHFTSLKENSNNSFKTAFSLRAHIKFINDLFRHPYLQIIQNQLIKPMRDALAQLPSDSDKAKKVLFAYDQIREEMRKILREAISLDRQYSTGEQQPPADTTPVSRIQAIITKLRDSHITTVNQCAEQEKIIDASRNKFGTFFKGLLGGLLAVPIGLLCIATLGKVFGYKKFMSQTFYSTTTRKTLQNVSAALNATPPIQQEHHH